jgi:hypothetical protein
MRRRTFDAPVAGLVLAVSFIGAGLLIILSVLGFVRGPQPGRPSA